MNNYTIKSNKIGEGMYNHELFDNSGNLMKKDLMLENGKTVEEVLSSYSIRMVQFMRENKQDSLESKI